MESATKNKKTRENVYRMLQKAFGKDITYNDFLVKELTEGYFNVAYEVLLVDKEMILKIAPPASSKVMSYEKDMMRAEVNALRLMEEHTKVPVPKVIFYDDTHTVCDADYFFMEKILGESFYKLKRNGMPQEEQEAILYEIGYYNEIMNQITGTSFGYIGQQDKQGSNWKETFCRMLEGVLTDGESIKISIGIDYGEVRTLINKASFCLDQVKTPNFVHWDLWDGNVFVKDGKISGIIDFERAIWGDPLMEYYFRSHSYNENFIKGYGSDLRKEAPIRALLYDMYLYLIMVIETKYRNYPEDWQYHFATKELAIAIDKLNALL